MKTIFHLETITNLQRVSLVLGSFGYFGFVLGAATQYVWLLLIGSVLCGVGGSLIWIGQGVRKSFVDNVKRFMFLKYLEENKKH